jgi:hypothetical protein
MENFILWSGWIAAVGIAVYELVKAYRNRTRINLSFNIVGGDLCISIHNWGRRAVTLVEAGLVYQNGQGTSYDERSPEFPMVLFNLDGFNLCFKIRDIARETGSDNTSVDYGYFTDHTGHMFKKVFPGELQPYLNRDKANAAEKGG